MRQEFITKYFNLLIYRLPFYTNSFIDEVTVQNYQFNDSGDVLTLQGVSAGLYTCIFKRVIKPTEIKANRIFFNLPTDWQANDLYFLQNDKKLQVENVDRENGLLVSFFTNELITLDTEFYYFDFASASLTAEADANGVINLNRKTPKPSKLILHKVYTAPRIDFALTMDVARKKFEERGRKARLFIIPAGFVSNKSKFADSLANSEVMPGNDTQQIIINSTMLLIIKPLDVNDIHGTKASVDIIEKDVLACITASSGFKLAEYSQPLQFEDAQLENFNNTVIEYSIMFKNMLYLVNKDVAVPEEFTVSNTNLKLFYN